MIQHLLKVQARHFKTMRKTRLVAPYKRICPVKHGSKYKVSLLVTNNNEISNSCIPLALCIAHYENKIPLDNRQSTLALHLLTRSRKQILKLKTGNSSSSMI
jgi:hypothetical protein